MSSVSDVNLMLSIVRRISDAFPVQIRTKTIWSETVLHYLLGKDSRCLNPLKVIKFCRDQQVNLDILASTEGKQFSADHEFSYSQSKWFLDGPERDEILSYLRRWREATCSNKKPILSYEEPESSQSVAGKLKKSTIKTSRTQSKITRQ